jgi:hypothetical protein
MRKNEEKERREGTKRKNEEKERREGTNEEKERTIKVNVPLSTSIDSILFFPTTPTPVLLSLESRNRNLNVVRLLCRDDDSLIVKSKLVGWLVGY